MLECFNQYGYYVPAEECHGEPTLGHVVAAEATKCATISVAPLAIQINILVSDYAFYIASGMNNNGIYKKTLKTPRPLRAPPLSLANLCTWSLEVGVMRNMRHIESYINFIMD